VEVPRGDAEGGGPRGEEGPLDEATRARGRRLAIVSHPAGMTHRMIFTEWLPTLALVQLGASEVLVGLQGSLEPFGQALQLPTLRAVARHSKRAILLAGQWLAILGGLPLLAFSFLEDRGGPLAVGIVLASFAVSTVGIVVGQTVWFPLLRSYVEPDAIGRFFGLIRSGWHLALIFFFLAASRWLVLHPGSLVPLFAVGLACGLLRIALIARLPERSERTGAPIRVREALALLRTEPELRHYLLGVGAQGALRSATFPFIIVMMRRVIGLSDAEVLIATVASFGGGLASLYLWGRVVDRVGPGRVFRWTTLGLAVSFLALTGVHAAGSYALVALAAIFFVRTVLASGFGVADTRVLFELAPEEAPARLLVVSSVSVSLVRGVAPLAVGTALAWVLAAGAAPLFVYQALFASAAVLQLLVHRPLRRFR
jgi:predicted MFS family arabinose efflux permease